LSYTPRYDNGDWIADCDVCGRKYKASALSQRWDGLMCCDDDWEIRQPQDFVRGVPDTQIAPWLRPEPPDYFIPVNLNAPIGNFNVTSNCSLLVQYIEGPARQNVTSIVSAFLTWVKRFPVLGGAREVNGSSINNNSIG
jgi:hypothetical protein